MLQSATLDVKLANRKQLHDPLVKFITNCGIPSELIESVCKEPIADTYKTVLDVVDEKSLFATSLLEGTKVGPEVSAQLTMLREEV
jgi:hypothetical protein